jgi:hypothetical protein
VKELNSFREDREMEAAFGKPASPEVQRGKPPMEGMEITKE